MSTPGSGSQQAVPSTVANQQWEAQRAIFKTPEYESVQSLFWTTTRQKRPAPSPQTSGLGTPAEPDKAAMEVEADIRAETEPEVSWMAADNRQAQKYAVGVQLLTTGWPQGMGPADREYMVGWFLLNTPKVVNFCYERGYVTDHNAHEIKRYLNALSTDPVTVPAGGEFYSGMTLLTFKAFELRLEVVKELSQIMQSPPSETTTPETTMWAEQWNRIMWGAQYELDQAEAQAVAAAKSQATVSGKGLQLGKGKRHWSSVAIHTNYYEPFPFNLQLIVVDKVYFSWDEMCDKFKAQQHKVGNYSICTVQGKPPAPVVEELNTQETEQSQLPVQPTTTPKVSTAAIPGTKGAAKSQSRPKGKGGR
ncbi:unnamed protein product [Symbiodinium pilosum]|uniref:Uncharacterized protein n=1 Tax=Symbiodinium pilosum TaxID=2952 RepID=A0A812TNP6_SYMPI|nr:unnamed protein product [Symbiodinium pilosum]